MPKKQENAYVTLALKQIGCTQKELAKKVDVSPTQITMWKNGEYMSLDMQNRFEDLLGIDGLDPDFVLWAGSIESAEKWQALIVKLGEDVEGCAETGYRTVPLLNELNELTWKIMYTLNEMGVPAPLSFPKELNEGNFEDDEDGWEERHEALGENPYTNLIESIFYSMNDVYGFFTAYLEDVLQDEEYEFITRNAEEFESQLMLLAATKVDADETFVPNFRGFRGKTLRRHQRWMTEIKNEAIKRGIPIRAEFMHLITEEHDFLGHEAERESLGFNAGAAHPDIYMNELLIGMRENGQMLQAIMNKLDITEADVIELMRKEREDDEDGLDEAV